MAIYRQNAGASARWRAAKKMKKPAKITSVVDSRGVKFTLKVIQTTYTGKNGQKYPRTIYKVTSSTGLEKEYLNPDNAFAFLQRRKSGASGASMNRMGSAFYKERQKAIKAKKSTKKSSSRSRRIDVDVDVEIETPRRKKSKRSSARRSTALTVKSKKPAKRTSKKASAAQGQAAKAMKLAYSKGITLKAAWALVKGKKAPAKAKSPSKRMSATKNKATSSRKGKKSVKSNPMSFYDLY